MRIYDLPASIPTSVKDLDKVYLRMYLYVYLMLQLKTQPLLKNILPFSKLNKRVFHFVGPDIASVGDFAKCEVTVIYI